MQKGEILQNASFKHSKAHIQRIMESQIITLTTDWGYRDFFVGKVKGKLLTYIPGVQIIDITHGIDPYKLSSAIFVVKQACMEYPQGTIHIIDVKSSQSKDNPFIVAKRNGQYYICTDNGLPHAIFGDSVEDIVVIDNIPQESSFYTFAALDLFCKVAAMIAHGAQLSDLGFTPEKLCTITPYNNTHNGNELTTYIAYIDSYGNADLNITYEDFERERKNRPFEVWVHEMRIKNISHSYIDVNESGNHRTALLLTVSSTGMLQLALREGSAEQLLGIRERESIQIKFL